MQSKSTSLNSDHGSDLRSQLIEFRFMFVNFKICINANIVLMGVRFLRLHELDIKITDRKSDIHLEIHPLADPDTRIY